MVHPRLRVIMLELQKGTAHRSTGLGNAAIQAQRLEACLVPMAACSLHICITALPCELATRGTIRIFSLSLACMSLPSLLIQGRRLGPRCRCMQALSPQTAATDRVHYVLNAGPQPVGKPPSPPHMLKRHSQLVNSTSRRRGICSDLHVDPLRTLLLWPPLLPCTDLAAWQPAA